MHKINIRSAQQTDAKALYALVKLFVGDLANTLDGISQYLQNHNDIICVAEDDGTLVGYACGRVSRHMSFRDPVADTIDLTFLIDENRN